MHALVVPALGINTVRANNLQFAALNLRPQYHDHAPVFVLKELSHGSGEYQQWHAGLSEHQRFHVAMKFGAVGLVVLAFHAAAYLTRLFPDRVPLPSGRQLRAKNQEPATEMSPLIVLLLLLLLLFFLFHIFLLDFCPGHHTL